MSHPLPHRLAAWSVHVYTALGFPLAFAAVLASNQLDFKLAFIFLAAATFIDSTDGMLARRLEVKKYVPQIDGALMDNIVDYLTYVFVPVYLAWMSEMIPQDAWGMTVVTLVLLASAYGFSHSQAKTEDHFFTGFPSYWNIVIYYLYLFGVEPQVNTWILLLLAALVFVPIRYLYPSRTPTGRSVTLWLGTLWLFLIVASLYQFPEVHPTLLSLSLIFPIYYGVLSLILHFQKQRS